MRQFTLTYTTPDLTRLPISNFDAKPGSTQPTLVLVEYS
jgi:hypothetical protein